jgi:hypothetical protein
MKGYENSTGDWGIHPKHEGLQYRRDDLQVVMDPYLLFFFFSFQTRCALVGDVETSFDAKLK